MLLVSGYKLNHNIKHNYLLKLFQKSLLCCVTMISLYYVTRSSEQNIFLVLLVFWGVKVNKKLELGDI